MKTIKTTEIHTGKGFTQPLNKDEKWVTTILDTVLSDYAYNAESISGQIQLLKTNKYVDVIGEFRLTFSPLCARCGEELDEHLNLSFQTHLAPLKDLATPATDEEEQELTKNDLESCFYENEEIVLDPILTDEIAMALPYNFYCKKDCKTATPASSNITVDDNTDPRWEALKDLKIPKQ